MNERDMDAPVTRGELEATLEKYPTRIELYEALERLAARMDQGFRELRVDMHALVKTSETAMIMRMEALLDPHRGVPERVSNLESEELPARVRTLEGNVLAPKRRTAKRARR